MSCSNSGGINQVTKRGDFQSGPTDHFLEDRDLQPVDANRLLLDSDHLLRNDIEQLEDRNLQEGQGAAELHVEEDVIDHQVEGNAELVEAVQNIFPQLSALSIENILLSFTHIPRHVVLDTVCSYIVENNDFICRLEAAHKPPALEQNLDSPSTSKQANGSLAEEPKTSVKAEIPYILLDDNSDEVQLPHPAAGNQDLKPMVINLVPTPSESLVDDTEATIDLDENASATNGSKFTLLESSTLTKTQKNRLKRKYCNSVAHFEESKQDATGQNEATYCDVLCSLTKSLRTERGNFQAYVCSETVVHKPDHPETSDISLLPDNPFVSLLGPSSFTSADSVGKPSHTKLSNVTILPSGVFHDDFDCPEPSGITTFSTVVPDELDHPRPSAMAIPPKDDAHNTCDLLGPSGVASVSCDAVACDSLICKGPSYVNAVPDGGFILSEQDHPELINVAVASAANSASSSTAVGDITMDEISSPSDNAPVLTESISPDNLDHPEPSGIVPNGNVTLEESNGIELSDNETQKLSENSPVNDCEELECNCCYCEVPFDYMVQCTEGHLFCCECLRRYTQEAIYGSGKVKLMCMADGCTSVFPKSQLERALPADLMKTYEEREAEESLNLAGLENLVRCPYCNYGAELEDGQLAFACQNVECKKTTCRLCQKDWKIHIDLTCEQVETENETNIRLKYEEQMAEAKIRQCHKCKAKYTKEDGCNKITCRCGASMCYLCRKPTVSYEHFCSHQQGKKKQRCKSCSIPCALWTDAEEDDARAIAELKKKAKQARTEQGFQEEKQIGAPEESQKQSRRSKRHQYNNMVEGYA